MLFDVSHLGTVRVEGADAFDRLQSALSNDLRQVGPGRAQYTHLLDDADGSVVDDIIVWWLSDEAFDVMPNASNTDRVVEAIGGEDTTATRCIIAVQGPHARTRLATVAPEAAAVPRFGVTPFVWDGVACVAAGTGYTGEDGVELAVPADAADALWTALLGHRHPARPASGPATPSGSRPACRCTGTSSARASPRCRPGWAGWSGGTRTGSGAAQALEAERREGRAAAGWSGLATEGRQPPRQGATVIDGRPAGGHGDQRELLAHAGPRHRPGLRGQPRRDTGRPEVGTALAIEQRGRTLAGPGGRPPPSSGPASGRRPA